MSAIVHQSHLEAESPQSDAPAILKVHRMIAVNRSLFLSNVMTASISLVPGVQMKVRLDSM